MERRSAVFLLILAGIIGRRCRGHRILDDAGANRGMLREYRLLRADMGSHCPARRRRALRHADVAHGGRAERRHGVRVDVFRVVQQLLPVAGHRHVYHHRRSLRGRPHSDQHAAAVAPGADERAGERQQQHGLHSVTVENRTDRSIEDEVQDYITVTSTTVSGLTPGRQYRVLVWGYSAECDGWSAEGKTTLLRTRRLVAAARGRCWRALAGPAGGQTIVGIPSGPARTCAPGEQRTPAYGCSPVGARAAGKRTSPAACLQDAVGRLVPGLP